MNSFQRDAVAQRMEHRRRERLDAMRQRIGARRGGQFGRQTAREFRIENHQAREQRG